MPSEQLSDGILKRSARDTDGKHGQKSSRFKNGCLMLFGRSERIRTFDPLHPMQVRYQTAPHSDSISCGL